MIDLATKQVDLVIKNTGTFPSGSIIGMAHVPDGVQIKFYRTLQKLVHDYNSFPQ